VKSSSRKKLEPKPLSITPREKEVMHLLAYGLSSKKIAEEMGISFHTVESFRKKLLQKFKAKTTVEMVLKAGNVLPREFWINQATADRAG
jgi:DNA-binding NarL/FixJ family response regulator